jgi:P4 family phage/plasmid primase-like protien
VRPELAEVMGKRILIAAELEEGTRLSTSIVKQLCSTDEISAEKKYRDPFRFRPTHTLVLYTNHLPRVGAMDTGIWRRLIVIPFDAVITGKSDIKNYADYLVENAGPAILSWIIEGAKKVIDANYRIEPPKVVRDAIRAYREGNDWLAHFLEECCETGVGLEQKAGEFYQEYRAFCQRTGEYTRSTSDFYSSLELAGFKRQKRHGISYILGLQLQSSDDIFSD